MSNPNASNLSIIVRGAYDVQKLRIQCGNRIVANFKAKLGLKPSKKEDTMDKEGKKLLQDLRQRFARLTDAINSFPRQSTFEGDEIISDYTELCLIAQYVELLRQEEQHFGRMGNILNDYPIWTQFLKGVCGCGPAMAGVIISEVDIHKARYASSIWSYAGLDVAGDGRGRSRRKEHLVEREYTDSNGQKKTRVGITFNPFLKTKLVGVLGPSFVKQPADRCKYRGIYDDYKHRLESHAVYGIANDDARRAEVKDKTGNNYAPRLHRHNMAVRYTVKRFVVDLYEAWRALEGLPISLEYHEAKLGHKHGQAA